MLLAGFSANAQKISLSAQNSTYAEVFKTIESKTGYTFAYNKSKFDVSRNVSVSVADTDLGAALQQVLAGSGFSYVISGKQIILTPVKEVAAVAAPAPKPAPKPVQKKPAPKPAPVAEAPAPAPASVPVEAPAPVVAQTPAPEPVAAPAPAPAVRVIPLPSASPQPEKSDKLSQWDAHTGSFAIKTNLLYWATTTANLGFEFRVSPRNTIDISGGYNGWATFSDNTKWKHLLVQPEFRWWLCNPFYGHFLGIHMQYSHFNIGNVPLADKFIFGQPLKDYRFEGDLVGAGFSYGYAWYLGPRWGLEATAGVGYNFISYKQYECGKCGSYIDKADRHYFGVTKLGLSLTYLIK